MLTDSADPLHADVSVVVVVDVVVDDVDVCAVVAFVEFDDPLDPPQAARSGTSSAHPTAHAPMTVRRCRTVPMSAPLKIDADGTRPLRA
jgi:hypothetical protein